MTLIYRIVVLYLLAVNSIICTSNHGSTVVLEVGSSDKNIEITLGIIKTIPEVEVLHTERSGNIVVHVYDEQLDNLKELLRESDKVNINKLIINKVADIKMAPEYKRNKRSINVNMDDPFKVDQYNTYDSILNYFDELELSHPDLCKVIEIGFSTEGRPIKVIRITANNNGSKARIYIDGTQHAREWISPATILQIIDKMIKRYSVREGIITSLLNKYEFYFNPVINPDGYHYTYTQAGKRMWRKNRRVHLNTTCEGVDLNRNWDFQWAGVGSSSVVCSNIYHGSEPFSELETQVTSNFLLKHCGTWLSYFSFHSFGQLILYPYSHTTNPAPDNDYFQSAGQVLADGIKMYRNTTYRVGSISNILYRASGSSESWAYGVVGIPYAYTMELPTKYSFSVPTDQFDPISTELIFGLWKFLAHIEQNRPELIEEIESNFTRHTKPTTQNPSTTIEQLNTTTTPVKKTTTVTLKLVSDKHCVGVFCRRFQTQTPPIASHSVLNSFSYIIISTVIVLHVLTYTFAVL